MSTIGKLFGRSPFSQLQQHMEQVTKCIDKMSEALDAATSGEFDSLDQFRGKAQPVQRVTMSSVLPIPKALGKLSRTDCPMLVCSTGRYSTTPRQR